MSSKGRSGDGSEITDDAEKIGVCRRVSLLVVSCSYVENYLVRIIVNVYSQRYIWLYRPVHFCCKLGLKVTEQSG